MKQHFLWHLRSSSRKSTRCPRYKLWVALRRAMRPKKPYRQVHACFLEFRSQRELDGKERWVVYPNSKAMASKWRGSNGAVHRKKQSRTLVRVENTRERHEKVYTCWQSICEHKHKQNSSCYRTRAYIQKVLTFIRNQKQKRQENTYRKLSLTTATSFALRLTEFGPASFGTLGRLSLWWENGWARSSSPDVGIRAGSTLW